MMDRKRGHAEGRLRLCSEGCKVDCGAGEGGTSTGCPRLSTRLGESPRVSSQAGTAADLVGQLLITCFGSKPASAQSV